MQPYLIQHTYTVNNIIKYIFFLFDSIELYRQSTPTWPTHIRHIKTTRLRCWMWKVALLKSILQGLLNHVSSHTRISNLHGYLKMSFIDISHIPFAGVYCPCCSQSQSSINDCQIDLSCSGDGQKYYAYPSEGLKGLKGVPVVAQPQGYSGCSPSQ